jgi:hypothetical protein
MGLCTNLSTYFPACAYDEAAFGCTCWSRLRDAVPSISWPPVRAASRGVSIRRLRLAGQTLRLLDETSTFLGTAQDLEGVSAGKTRTSLGTAQHLQGISALDSTVIVPSAIWIFVSMRHDGH